MFVRARVGLICLSVVGPSSLCNHSPTRLLSNSLSSWSNGAVFSLVSHTLHCVGVCVCVCVQKDVQLLQCMAAHCNYAAFLRLAD